MLVARSGPVTLSRRYRIPNTAEMGRPRRGEPIVAPEQDARPTNLDTPVARKPRWDAIRPGDEEMLLTVQGHTRFVPAGAYKDGSDD